MTITAQEDVWSDPEAAPSKAARIMKRIRFVGFPVINKQGRGSNYLRVIKYGSL